jgi:hypothetical protein
VRDFWSPEDATYLLIASKFATANAVEHSFKVIPI